MSIKVTKEDKFVWKILTNKEAIEIFSSTSIQVFELRDDDSESKIENSNDLFKAIKKDAILGIEVGFIPKKEVKKTVSFTEKGDKTILKKGTKIIGFVLNEKEKGYSYNIGRPSDKNIPRFIGKKPLSKTQAKNKIIEVVIKNNKNHQV